MRSDVEQYVVRADTAIAYGVHSPDGLTVTVYLVIVAPPFDSGSSQSTVTSVEELAVRDALRGADAVVAETD